MADSIEDKVKDIIVEQLGVNEEQVTPEAKFIEDLGAEEYLHVDLSDGPCLVMRNPKPRDILLGTHIKLTASQEHFHYFDAAGARIIRPSEAITFDC